VVFGWTRRGELRGKGGLLTGDFQGLWITQFGKVFLRWVLGTLDAGEII
jgi:hypothetical protein